MLVLFSSLSDAVTGNFKIFSKIVIPLVSIVHAELNIPHKIVKMLSSKATNYLDCRIFVYNIPYRRARAWPLGRVHCASKGILHTSRI